MGKRSVVLRFFALVALKGVELADCGLRRSVNEFIEFDRDKTLFTVNLDGIGCFPNTNRTGRFSILLGLFIIPNLKTRSMEEMTTESPDIHLSIKTNRTIIIRVS